MCLELSQNYVKVVREKRQYYVQQNKTFLWGFQREIEEQMAKKRFKSGGDFQRRKTKTKQKEKKQH